MSGFVDQTASAVEHCTIQSQKYPSLSSKYDEMADFVSKKLWHQLTVAVLAFVEDQANLMDNNFSQLYQEVVLCVENKLDQLSLCRIAAAVALSVIGAGGSNTKDSLKAAKDILQQLLDKHQEGDNMLQEYPRIFLQSKLYLIELQPFLADTSQKDLLPASIKTTITQNQVLMGQDSTGATTESASVHAAHYELALNFYRVVGPPEAFYEQAMRFLSYAPAPTSTGAGTTDYAQLAVDLVLAGLTGEGVYNLGQLERTPILGHMDPANQWLVELLQTIAIGNVDAFNQLSQQYASQMAAQPALVHRRQALQEKLTLLALVTLLLEKGPHERLLNFDEIATRLQVPLDQVEWVLMRALSVGLVEGDLDQVEQEFHVTHVLPRSLNAQQLQDLAVRYGEWAQKVTETRANMLEQTPALFA